MGFGRLRFRRSFGQVKSQFRGARPKFYPLFTGLLDTYTGAAAAYSLRRLSKSVSSVVRVRRSSDNAERDFTEDGVSDGTLVAWVGAGNDGFVPTLYDQSGNGSDAVQQVSGSQPKIVDAGVLVSGGLEFDGVDDFLGQTITLTHPTTMFSAYKALSNSSFVTGSASSSLSFGRRFNGQYSMFAGTTIAAGTHPSTEVLASCLFNTTSSTGHWNGVEVLSGDVGTRTDFDYVGRNSSNYFNGTIQEIITYNTDQSANRAAIEANINNHYDIY